MIHDYGVARVRPARTEDASALAPRLRKADLQEIEAGSARTPEDALRHALEVSRAAYAVETASGEVVALFGVADTHEPKLGAVWLLGSEQIKTIRLAFLRHSKKWLNQLSSDFQLLGNFVDARNELHIEWLRWLGFRFLRRAPIGRNGEMFVEFVKLSE